MMINENQNENQTQNSSFEFSPTIMRDHPLAEKIRKKITKALADYHMLSPHDHVMVCVSGGKDSTILSLLLQDIQKKAPFPFSFKTVLLDQKQPGFDGAAFSEFFRSEGLDLIILESDTYSIVKEKIPEGQTTCSLCSRLRRGILYNYAYEHQFHKMMLGHHRDDLLETLLMNIFYQGKIASMPPKLFSDDGRNIVLRPMVYVPENELRELRDLWKFPVIPCKLCGNLEGAKRDRMEQLLNQLERETPGVKNNMLSALQSLAPSQLMDKRFFDFERTDNEHTHH